MHACRTSKFLIPTGKMKRAQPGEGRGLGLFLKQRKGATGLVVASLQEGGAAERSGKVIVGDRVIAVCV